VSAHFKIPLNLPHAATVATRLLRFVELAGIPDALVPSRELAVLLAPFRFSEENPDDADAARVTGEAARLGRAIADGVAASGKGYDRLGQAVRNLFECLALGEEGAALGLRAGEDPNSIMRPT
jgi:hypothetical protein